MNSMVTALEERETRERGRERRKARGGLSSWVVLTRKEQLCHMEVKSNGKALVLYMKEKKKVKGENDLKEFIRLGSHQSL